MTAPTSPEIPPRLLAVAPTFNNAATLPQVLTALKQEGFQVLVVDDGSTDETANVLAELRTGVTNLRHSQNRGKAAAMLSGFAEAKRAGFTHALTIDTDGQHDPADAVRIRDVALRYPDAIIVGTRPCGPGYPLRSRMGRALSNGMIRLLAGLRVCDSQCGLRVYPLDVVERLGAKSGRYAFETEILIRAAWANVAVREVPVRCIYELPGGRVTHFRLIRDSLSAIAMHARLLTRSLAPWPVRRLRPLMLDAVAPGTIFERARRWLSPLRAWRQLRHDARERDRLGASIGWGLFVGTQLPLGYKGALCLLLAKIFRLQPLVVLGTSSLSTPPLGFVLWAAAIVSGHLVLHGAWPQAQRYDFSHLSPPQIGALARMVAIEWIVGGIVFGGALGLAAWLVTTLIVRCLGGSAAGRGSISIQR